MYTHEPHFLKSGTKSLRLISKNMNLNKVAILVFSNLGYVFTLRQVFKNVVAEFLLNLAIL